MLKTYFYSEIIYILHSNILMFKTNYHCMPLTLINDISIADVVYDYMLVQVINPALHELTLQYAIKQEGNNTVIRKGSFKGQAVQLRVAHMPEGSYDFCIATEGCEPCNFSFEKRSDNMEQFFVHR